MPRYIGVMKILRILFFIVLTNCSGCVFGNVETDSDYREAIELLEVFIGHEMSDKGLPALSIALVDDQRTVWATGFGMANPDDRTPATERTVYRVGSVSKLFTDLGIMQLVEQGSIDLDAPITDYIPEFHPESRFDASPTLRQLMSHRSGLVREPPVGHYFDDSDASLGATVQSLNGTAIVYEPETRIKYSNAGIATVGYVLEHTQGQPFTEYLKSAVLEPLGMDNSSFTPDPDIIEDLALAYMWTYDGRTFEAPTFQLGMAPAGSMYAPVTDLAKFMSALFAGGMGENGRVVSAATLEAMWTPQFAAPEATTGYGIGFGLSRLDGHRRIGHGGAIYGFATDLSTLPDEKLGVVAATTMDGANAVVRRITTYALQLMLAVKEGRPLPDAEVTAPPSRELANSVAGTYERDGERIEIVARPDQLFATLPDRRVRLMTLGETLVVDDRFGYGLRIERSGDDAIVVDGDTFTRVANRKPMPVPERWRGLIGEYGWDYNTLYIFEKDGRLTALIEWFFIDPLTEISPDVFAFPNRGLYHGEQLVFHRDGQGRATSVDAAGVAFPRREVGTEAGETFTIDPVRPVEELRREALAATPPVESGEFVEPDLVELHSLDPSIAYDIRYATTNNFMQSVFYDEAKAFMQRPAAEAVARAHQKLNKLGFGLLIHDAYRPWYVTKMFWDATPEDKKIFVANPDDGSRHNRGAAVDLTLYDLETNEVIEMVGGYDEMSERSFPEYAGGTSRQRWHRELLRRVMEREGFTVYEFEWWHFDYGDWSSYPISNVTFDQLIPER